MYHDSNDLIFSIQPVLLRTTTVFSLFLAVEWYFFVYTSNGERISMK